MKGNNMVDLPTPLLSEAVGSHCPNALPIWERLAGSATKNSERVAIISFHQPQDLYGFEDANEASRSTHLRWSYGTLTAAVERLATGLRNRGLKRGDAIITYLYNGIEFILSFWVAHKLGCTFVPLNPQSLHNWEESTHTFRLVTPSVVIVNDNTTACRADGVLAQGFHVPSKIVAGGSNGGTGWASLQSFLLPHSKVINQDNQTGPAEPKPVALLFTSGTTALPKGVPHTDTTLNAFSENLSLGGRSESNIFCAVLPNNHAIGYFFPLHFMMNGGAIVYPSATFDPEKMIVAMEHEKVTHTALVPTTLHRLLECLRYRSTPFKSCLTDVCLAGSTVTPEDLRYVVGDLGSTGVSTGFGMTEGSPIWSASLSPDELIDGHVTFSGHVSPCASIKICAPESRDPLPLGEVGELHQSGPGLVNRYLGGADEANNQFYHDHIGHQWFITGDQAVMQPGGRVSIVGRYKDIINRGGMKISPAAMEAVIRRTCSESVQVIGIPDKIAGNVPIVVCFNSVQASAEDMRNAVVSEMGSKCSPVHIVRLRELGLDDFPRTSSGKIQKSKLLSVYLEHYKKIERGDDSPVTSHYEDCLLQAYSKATGIHASELDRSRPVSFFADSIATMRVRDDVRKTLGIAFSVRDMADHETLNSQIALLQERTSTSQRMAETSISELEPFSVTYIATIWPLAEKSRKMESLISNIVKAKGFQWPADVSAVIPVYDYMQVLVDTHIIDTWNFAIALQTTCPTIETLRAALCTALTNNPIFTCFYAGLEGQHGAYVTIHPSQQLWEQCIFVEPSLKSRSDLQMLAMAYPYKNHARFPGPLFSAVLVYVEETKSAAMVYYVHHIVHDAASTRSFLSDLDHVLANPGQTPRRHTDFTAWASSFHSLRQSPLATLSVEYHVHRLRNLHKHRDGLYPPAPLPRRPIEEIPDSLDYAFDAPGLVKLKEKLRGIGAATVLKGAMALVNISRTGYTHAMFNNMEAGRGQFPFVPASLQAMDPAMWESADVNGPTMAGACNLIEVLPDESALHFLSRLQEDQVHLTKHCHAPLRRILERLGEEGNGSDEMMMEIHRTQFLSWVPGFLGDYDHLEVSQLAIRCAAGLVIVGGIGGPKATTYACSLRWDIANYSRKQTEDYIKDVEIIIQLLTSEEHWHNNLGELLQKVKR